MIAALTAPACLARFGRGLSTMLARAPVAHLLACALCGGLVASLGVRSTSWLLAGSGLGLVASAAVTRLRHRATAALLIGLMLLGLWWGAVRLDASDRSVLRSHIGTTARVVVETTGPARRGGTVALVPVVVRQLAGSALDEPAQLEVPVEGELPGRGTVLEAIVQIRVPAGPRQTDSGGTFDERAFLRRSGRHVVLSTTWYVPVGARGGLAGASDRLRTALSGAIGLGMGPEQAQLVRGIVLGEDEGIDPELLDRFRASGLYHLLAVSGQNVAYVAAGVLLLSWAVGIPRAVAAIAAIGAIGAYVAAVGWQPSVVRAAIAGALALLAWLVARPRDRWYLLLVGAVVLLAVNPRNLLDPGFQLSFVAVAAIFLIVPRLESAATWLPVPARLASILVVPIAAGAATAPVLWLHFRAVPVLTVPANAMAEPVVAPILGLGLVTAALEPLLPEAAYATGWLNGWLASYLAWCAHVIGGLPFAEARSAWAAAGVASLAAAPLLPWLRKRVSRRAARRAAVAAATSVALLIAWQLTGPGPAVIGPPSGLRLAIVDVGQGDAIVAQRGEEAIVVDQGPPGAGLVGELRRLSVHRVAALVVTHPQRDHVGGAVEVLEELPVELLVLPGLPHESEERDMALETARALDVPIHTARRGDVLQLGEVRLDVLWPDGPGTPLDDPNDRSIVTLLSFGAFRALLTGDAEAPVTLALDIPRVDLLKVAHHGSEDTGLPELLRRLTPTIAVVSVGDENRFGHPHETTLDALARVPGLRLLRTDLAGTILIETDGQEITTSTAKPATPRAE